MKRNPRGDPSVSDLKKYLAILLPGVPEREVEQQIDDQYYYYGSPYIVICRICRGLYPCLVVRRTPIGDEEFSDEPLGILVFANNDYLLDEKIEYLMKLAKIIRSYGKRTGFYLPLSSLKAVVTKLCDEKENPRFEVYSLKPEEASVFMEE